MNNCAPHWRPTQPERRQRPPGNPPRPNRPGKSKSRAQKEDNMTADELHTLKAAAATIKNTGHLYRAALAYSPEGKPGGNLLRDLRTLAARSLAGLQESRFIIEAHATSGQPFPALARDLFDLLSAGFPEWLEYLSNTEAAAWEGAARAILAAAGCPSGSNENAARNEEAGARKLAFKLDRDKLSGLFVAPFTTPQKETGANKFESFYNQLATRAASFNTTDFGRIAYQIRQSNNTRRCYRDSMTFAEFLRLFCEFCGITPPKDQRPRVYEKITRKTDFSIWL